MKDFLKKEEEIQKVVDTITETKFKISDVNTKIEENPLAPFTTSTLQQTASGRFGLVLELCRLLNVLSSRYGEKQLV